MENMEKEIRGNWFKDHVAKTTRFNQNILILDWAKPKTNAYRVRYILDGGYLFVSGDLGEAAFCLTWNAGKEGLKSLADKDLSYVFGKISAWDGEKYDFDSDQAIGYFDAEIAELKEQYNDWGKDKFLDHKDILVKMKAIAGNCRTGKEFTQKILHDNLFDELSDYDPYCHEWVFSIGDTIPYRIESYLIGIKMAYEQLEELGKNNDL